MPSRAETLFCSPKYYFPLFFKVLNFQKVLRIFFIRERATDLAFSNNDEK